VTRSVAFILKHNQNLEWGGSSRGALDGVRTDRRVRRQSGLSYGSRSTETVALSDRSNALDSSASLSAQCTFTVRERWLANDWRANDHRLRTQWAAIKVFMITAHAVRFSTRVGCCIGPTFGVRCGV